MARRRSYEPCQLTAGILEEVVLAVDSQPAISLEQGFDTLPERGFAGALPGGNADWSGAVDAAEALDFCS